LLASRDQDASEIGHRCRCRGDLVGAHVVTQRVEAPDGGGGALRGVDPVDRARNTTTGRFQILSVTGARGVSLGLA
jgi:hypothetical protein